MSKARAKSSGIVRVALVLVTLVFSVAVSQAETAPGSGIVRLRALSLDERVDAQAVAAIVEDLPARDRGLGAVKEEGNAVVRGLLNALGGRGTDVFPFWAGRGVIVGLTDEQTAELSKEFPSIQVETLPESLVSAEPQILGEAKTGQGTPCAGPVDQTWNLVMSGAYALAKDRNLTGEGTILGVLGPDLPFNHPALGNRITFHKNFGLPPAFSESNNGLDDLRLIHPLGIAGGDQPKVFCGVAPKVEFALAQIQKGKVPTDQFLQGIQWLLEPGMEKRPVAVLICVDFTVPAPKIVRQALQGMRNAGILPIVPAGNISERITGMAALPECLTVGALDQWKKRALFSGKGPVIVDQVQYTKPDLMEPGVAILGPAYDSSARYRFGSGTLQAAAHFAGIWAQMKQARPDDDIDSILYALATTTVDLGPTGTDNETGMGIVDPSAALYFLENPPPEIPSDTVRF